MKTTEKTRPTTAQEKQALIYLNKLRDSGETNMFGATPWLITKFDVTKAEAHALLSLWIANFCDGSNYETVKI